MPSLPIHLLPLAALLVCLFGCSGDAPPQTPAKPAQPAAPRSYGCADCHPYQLDDKHSFACTVCHHGKEKVRGKEEAHAGLLSRPAHPDHMAETCGSCHPNQVSQASHSLHFSNAHEINMVRRAFGATTDLDSANDIPVPEKITTPLDLVDDLLRRRCLRCHISYDGDSYLETLRGTGCAACHLEFIGASLTSHAIVRKTPDSQCLHCHNSNFVGTDYYGRAEHDFHWDYRTPYGTRGEDAPRPYGVEYHQLSQDIHLQAGLRCIDCHPGGQLMSGQSATRCQSCHLYEKNHKTAAPLALREEKGQILLTVAEKELAVPQLRHPAHAKYQARADCAVCHSTWAFSDEGTYLFRQDDDEYEPWEAISVQGSFEVEQQVSRNINLDEGDPFPFMSDKLTGETRRGLWHKGFGLRRWEFPLICADEQGKLHICRPILDLHLSWVNGDEEVMMDDVQPGHAPKMGLVPYMPHTIGKAGPYYRQRLKTNLHLLKQPLNLDKGPGLNPAMADSTDKKE